MVRYAHQFDELMEYFLESEEEKSEADDNGYVFIKNVYERLGYEIGEPASQKKEEDKKDEESK
jgi:hypothetical protein